ncbi:MAG: DUF6602 domain-containing protein [Eubacteriales bacterium]
MVDSQTNAFGVRKVISNYFEKKAEILLAELQRVASLTNNTNEIGNVGEESIRSFLREVLPSRYGVGTGHVVSFDETSAQTDIVIYDANNCFTIPISEKASLYSQEGVYATIEVKASPSKKSNIHESIKDAVNNSYSIKKTSRPFPFSVNSKIPAFINLQNGLLFAEHNQNYTNLMFPISVILLIGCNSNFSNVMTYFQQEQSVLEHWHYRPDLLCVIDESNFGLCGNDFILEEKKVVQKFWKEKCESVGDTLSKLIYWIIHKITLERIIEYPMIYNKNIKAIWPSVIAPVVERIHVSTNETGTQKSWPWLKETREFID